MIPTGVASAMSVLASAPSKVPFYVAGGALASWAVLLAVFGITRPGFPASKAGRGGVIGASALLVVATMALAVATAGEEEQEAEAGAASGGLALVADPSGATAYDRTEGTVRAGAVKIHLTNEAPIGHNVAVADGDRELGRSDTVTGGETELRLDLQPGEYAFYCTVTGHRAAGMEGVLTVR